MATTNHYELIVLGDDLAGLVAAALVARRGKRVLVIPHGTSDRTYKLGQRTYPLDTAPVLDLGAPAVRRVFEELGLWTQIRRERRTLEGPIQFVLPGERLDLGPEERGFEQEAARVWPEDPVSEAWDLRRRWAVASDELLDEVLGSDTDLGSEKMGAKRLMARVEGRLPHADVDELEPLPPSHPLRALHGCIEPWALHLSPRRLGKAARLRLARSWARGPEDCRDGLAGLRRTLVQRIELKSGEVKPELRVSEILHKRGKIIGVGLLGKRDRYGCDHLLIASDPRMLLDGNLLPRQLPKALAAELSGIESAAHRFVMHLEVAETGLGPALGELAVVVPVPGPGGAADEWRWRDGAGLSYVRVAPTPKDGTRHVCVTRVLGRDESLDDARERTLDDLDRRAVLPFVHDHLRLVHSPHDGRPPTDGAGNELNLPVTRTGTGSPMRPLYDPPGAPSLGLGLLPRNSGIKNLSFASRLNFPGLGMEGEFLAGWVAAAPLALTARVGLGRNLFLGRG